MNYWLVKQEPEDYSWSDFLKDGKTAWTGVRSFPARKNLRGMKAGDLVFFYHSGEAKSVVGLARVAREAYPDPTAGEEDWSAVDLAPVKAVGKTGHAFSNQGRQNFERNGAGETVPPVRDAGDARTVHAVAGVVGNEGLTPLAAWPPRASARRRLRYSHPAAQTKSRAITSRPMTVCHGLDGT